MSPTNHLKSSGGVVVFGGPALVRYVSPTDEELFQRYNPELKRKSLERRYERQKEFDDFVVKLKEQSKSSKPSEYRSGFPVIDALLTTFLQSGLFKQKKRRQPNRQELKRVSRLPKR
jgi:hypothetical protein